MKAHYLQLWEYNCWANARILNALEENMAINNRIFLLTSHILVAQQVWFDRIQGVSAPIDRLWDTYDLPTLKRLHKQTSADWQAFLEESNAFDFKHEFAYKNSKGDNFSSCLADILTHLVNHGTYHRGQVSNLLKQERIDPPVTDYIAFARERSTIK